MRCVEPRCGVLQSPLQHLPLVKNLEYLCVGGEDEKPNWIPTAHQSLELAQVADEVDDDSGRVQKDINEASARGNSERV